MSDRLPPPRAISVDRIKGILKTWELPEDSGDYEVVRQYSVSVGLEAWQTPGGFFRINTKAKDPEWKVPDSEWAIELDLIPGTIVPGGDPNNPLKERWLGVTDPEDGIGIHGTGAVDKLGEPASHGCIRMRPRAVIEVYSFVPNPEKALTPIYIE